ncbi:MAG: rhomboid family intramembrane serine protease, partial [Actinomycetota bacterium]|nr:rhomboid family intramembrane serine protease [Actinomycetota bacterium]
MSTAATPRSTRLDGIRVLGFLIAVMWLSEVVDTVAGHRFDQYGIEPRDGDGLIGIGAAPFLHSGFG